MKSPIFIFSLPRSGSTLLQRILMSHKEIASVAEPWLLLPFFYAHKKEGVLTEYSHATSFKALEDFINNLPNKEDDYYKSLNYFCQTLYDKQCKKNETYFLDKTPRYYLIIPEIVKTFPNAKFIFLFRNPVHVYSSIINTWGNGYLKNLYVNERDLNFGSIALSQGYKSIENNSYALQYEEFVCNSKKYTQEICNYLDIDFDVNMLDKFSNQNTKGRAGDSSGVKDYKIISHLPLNKWKETFNTPFRKKMIYNFINKIDDEILKTQGYEKRLILQEINKLKVFNKHIIKDRIDYWYTKLIKLTKANIFFSKKVWTKGKYLS